MRSCGSFAKKIPRRSAHLSRRAPNPTFATDDGGVSQIEAPPQIRDITALGDHCWMLVGSDIVEIAKLEPRAPR